jgi:hypothetical protein
VLPSGGEVDLVDFRIAGVNSSVSAAITLHSGDEWVFCVPWHQQYRFGRGVNVFLGLSDSSSEVVSSSDFRFDRFEFLFQFERFFLSFFSKEQQLETNELLKRQFSGTPSRSCHQHLRDHIQ